ncbi:MAG: hypothetical protein ACOY90_09275 [Candidatus Zhuqueibacterota bacterium]
MAAEYRRKISAEEVKDRYIIILKDSLELFPKIGKMFRLKVKDAELETRIETMERWSLGPKKPQIIYKIDAEKFWAMFPLHFGKSVSIKKESDDLYVLS